MTKTFQADIEKRLEDSHFAEKFGESIAKAEIAVTVSQARRIKGITQQELANKIGKTQSYIAKLESGDANPTVGNVGKILSKLRLRIVAGINELSSKIKNKELSVSSLDSNNTLYYNYLFSQINQNTSAAVASAARIPRLGNLNLSIHPIVAYIDTSYVAESSTDILWQATDEEKKTDFPKIKEGV